MTKGLYTMALALAMGANAYADSALETTAQDTVMTRGKHATHLADVVVTGTRQSTATSHLPMTVTVIDNKKLTENQRIDILPTLTEQVPGLFATQRGMMGYGVSGGAAGGISLRGLSSGTGQLMVLIDGTPQYQGIFGHSIADAYHTLTAERVEVLRGPASVLYGSNAMGGVVNIITKSPHAADGGAARGGNTNIHVGAGSYGTVQSSASTNLRKGKLSSTLGVEYNRSDNHRANMGFEQFGGYAKVGYDISRHWNTYADINLTHFTASNPGSENSPLLDADQWITRGVATLNVAHQYDKVNGRITLYDNFGHHKINDGHAPGADPQKELFLSDDALAGASIYENLRLFKGSNITLGVDYQHIYGHAYYTDLVTNEVVTAGKRGKQSCLTHSNEVAGYVDVRQDFTRWLTVDAGVRYDWHDVAGGEWIPQVGIVARPMKTGEIKAIASKGFRNPTTKDLFLYGSANDSLRAERLWNFELAWNHRLLDGRLRYGVNVFYIEGDNMIQTIAMHNVNTGAFKNCGAELDATWHINRHWTLTTNHSYLHMSNPIVASPEYKGYIGANMRYGKWTANLGIMQLANLYTEVGKDAKKCSPTLLNANVAYQVLPQLQLWVKGDNLLAQRYEINAGYPMPLATFMGGVNIRF